MDVTNQNEWIKLILRITSFLINDVIWIQQSIPEILLLDCPLTLCNCNQLDRKFKIDIKSSARVSSVFFSEFNTIGKGISIYTTLHLKKIYQK